MMKDNQFFYIASFNSGSILVFVLMKALDCRRIW